MADFSIDNRDQQALALSEINLNNLIQDCIQLFRNLYGPETRIITKPMALGDENLKLITDESRLCRVIVALMDYIAHPLNNSEIYLNYTGKEGTIEFYVSGKNGSANFTAYLSEIRTTIELLGGSFLENYRPHNDVTVNFTLPAVFKLTATEKMDTTASLEKPDFRGKVFLVVEDEPSNYYILKEILEPTNAELIWVKEGYEAIDICKNRENIDLVLMDLKLPTIDGYEATKKIKEFKPLLPIIAQTAYAMGDDKDKALSAGCDGYISKPIHRIELFRLLKKTLEK